MTTTEALAAALRRPAVPAGVRLPLALTAVPASVAVVWLGIRYAGSSEASAVDDRLHGTLDRLVPGPYWAAHAVNWVGEPAGVFSVVIVIGALCALLGRWRLALLAAAAQGLLGVVTGLVKPLFDRTIHGGFLAYPSGHTAGGAAYGIVLALLLVSLVGAGRFAGTVAVVLITSVAGGVAAWAQTLLVAHYATDTIGGFCLALALVPPAGMLIDAVADRLLDRAPGTPDA